MSTLRATVGMLLASIVLVSACTIRPISEAKQGTGALRAIDASDPDRYAEEIWESRILPAFRSESVELGDLLEDLMADQEATEQRLGHRSGTGPYSFMVTGSGRVVDVQPESLTVQLGRQNGEPEILIETAPAILGTAIRDAVGFIDFADFVNQVDFARVATALNKKVQSDVLSKTNFTQLDGRLLTFYGAYTHRPGDDARVVPVILESEGSR